LFVDRANGDLHLQAASPCIDAGYDPAVTAGETDLDGKPRILGAHVDIGAYESAAPGPEPFTMAHVARALGITGGVIAATPDDAARLNLEPGSAPNNMDVLDASRIARKVAGLDPNP
jgi:hypothetical protein